MKNPLTLCAKQYSVQSSCESHFQQIPTSKLLSTLLIIDGHFREYNKKKKKKQNLGGKHSALCIHSVFDKNANTVSPGGEKKRIFFL